MVEELGSGVCDRGEEEAPCYEKLARSLVNVLDLRSKKVPRHTFSCRLHVHACLCAFPDVNDS